MELQQNISPRIFETGKKKKPGMERASWGGRWRQTLGTVPDGTCSAYWNIWFRSLVLVSLLPVEVPVNGLPGKLQMTIQVLDPWHACGRLALRSGLLALCWPACCAFGNEPVNGRSLSLSLK